MKAFQSKFTESENKIFEINCFLSRFFSPVCFRFISEADIWNIFQFTRVVKRLSIFPQLEFYLFSLNVKRFSRKNQNIETTFEGIQPKSEFLAPIIQLWLSHDWKVYQSKFREGIMSSLPTASSPSQKLWKMPIILSERFDG